jgi:hypothetical protein
VPNSNDYRIHLNKALRDTLEEVALVEFEIEAVRARLGLEQESPPAKS